MHDAASVVWCAECSQGLVGAPFFHDCRYDFPLFWHPRSLCGLVLSIFRIFPVGPGCEQQGYLVEGGNEERCGGLGHLSGGGGRSRGVVLRLLFSAFVIVLLFSAFVIAMMIDGFYSQNGNPCKKHLLQLS